MPRFIQIFTLLIFFVYSFHSVGVGSGESCYRNLRAISKKGLLPMPTDPVASLREKHWTVSKAPEGLQSEGVVKNLEQAFNRIFTKYGNQPSAARVLIGGLKGYKPRDTENIATVNEATARVINQWANETLELAKKATGEDLVIVNVSMGRGHRVGNDEGTLIHADTGGTYLHALVTLKGPTTVAFPSNSELGNHRLISVDSKTGEMKVRKIDRKSEVQPAVFTIETGGQTLPGETLVFGGADYAVAKPGRVAIQHASPPTSNLNRLTLFISLEPRK